MSDHTIPPPHMSPQQFRTHGHALIDWIASYMQSVQDHPVRSPVSPGEIRALLPGHPPLDGEPFEAMLTDVDRIIMPGITHWQSPNFFAYFPANASGPSILGELLSAGLGVQGMLWSTSPACTELETHVLDWLVEMLDLPVHFRSDSSGGGVLQDTASSAVLCALLAARERLAQSSRAEASHVIYTSQHAHSSIEKAVRIAGYDASQLRLIDVDDTYAMRPDALQRVMDEDVANGRIPLLACATVGSTSSHAMDPLRGIGEACRSHNAWLHVDAAHAGTAALCNEFRGMHDGLELADSYCFNPHKWMFTNFDCDCFFVKLIAGRSSTR
jgi:aromatic-L-amino-acid decarboxylase